MWKLTPHDDKFIVMLQNSSQLLPQATQWLYDVSRGIVSVDEAMTGIDTLKTTSRQQTEEIAAAVWQSYITPMDREDLYDLAKHFHDFVRIIHAAIERFKLYRLGDAHGNLLTLAESLHQTAGQIPVIVHQMKVIRANAKHISAACDLLAEREMEADYFYRHGLAELFDSGSDPILIIKWREIFQHIEKAFDHCESIGAHIKQAVIKYV
ncbi:MAG TPA: DUF47 family protein [Bacillota bacterium]|nr:DUF47 family protein [Bacillota bacterium]